MKTAEEWSLRIFETCEVGGNLSFYGDRAAEVIRAIQADAQPTAGWMPIETAPKGDNDFFLVGCSDPNDGRRPFVFRGDILATARQANCPKHLSMHYITHWMQLPPPPSDNKPVEGVG